MKNKKFDVIKCPQCGCEYLPAEIFLPKLFVGNAFMIDRDQNHRIIDFCGNSMNMEETYICDYCNTKFKVTGKIQFFTKEAPTSNFDSEYVTSLKKEHLFLSED